MNYRIVTFILLFNHTLFSIPLDYDALYTYITNKYLFNNENVSQETCRHYIDSEPYEKFLTDCSLNPMLKQWINDLYGNDLSRKESAQQFLQKINTVFKNRAEELKKLSDEKDKKRTYLNKCMGWGILSTLIPGCVLMLYGASQLDKATQYRRINNMPLHDAAQFKGICTLFPSVGFFVGFLAVLFGVLRYENKHQLDAFDTLYLVLCQSQTYMFSLFFDELLLSSPEIT